MKRRSDTTKNEPMVEEHIITSSTRSRLEIRSSAWMMMTGDATDTSNEDTRDEMTTTKSLPQSRSLPSTVHTALPSTDDDNDSNGDEMKYTLLSPPQPSYCPYVTSSSESVGHRFRASRQTRSKSSKSKFTFPSLTVSIAMQNSWTRRNRRHHGRCSIISFVCRNHRLPTLVSFAFLLMTISSLSSTLFLKKQQLQYYQQQSVDVPHRSLEEQQKHQKQLYRRRQLRTPSKTVGEEFIAAHYLSFASSFTTETKQSSDTIPYPYILDATVQVATIPTTGSSSRWTSYAQYVDFVAACTQSLVDGTVKTNDGSLTSSVTATQQVPDVITIEYSLEADLKKENYLVLVQRLRQRYPNALIVLVQLLQDPSNYLYLVEESPDQDGADPNVVMSFQQWKEDQSFLLQAPSSTNITDELVQGMFEATTDPERNPHGLRYWTIVKPPNTPGSVLTNVFESDSHVLHYTNPLWETKFTATHIDEITFKEQMTTFWNHFSLLGTHISLSTSGHLDISTGIRKLTETHFRTNEETNRQRAQSGHEVIGDWGSGDDCHIWYSTGDYRDIESVGGRTVNVPAVTNNEDQLKRETVISNFADFIWNILVPSSSLAHKHALEFSRTNPSSFFDITSPSNNYIVVNNPFATSRLLSLSYLTDLDGMSYPKTLIVLNDIPSVQIQPIHELSVSTGTSNDNDIADKNNHYWQQNQHVAKTSNVGYIPPGKSIVRFNPLQTTELPFRVVGVSVLAEELYHSTEYAFELDVTTVAVTDVNTKN